jgi:hypothetical protein
MRCVPRRIGCRVREPARPISPILGEPGSRRQSAGCGGHGRFVPGRPGEWAWRRCQARSEGSASQFPFPSPVLNRNETALGSGAIGLGRFGGIATMPRRKRMTASPSRSTGVRAGPILGGAGEAPPLRRSPALPMGWVDEVVVKGNFHADWLSPATVRDGHGGDEEDPDRGARDDPGTRRPGRLDRGLTLRSDWSGSGRADFRRRRSPSL